MPYVYGYLATSDTPVQPPQAQPPGIWGPTDPRPSNPIYWPGFPGGGGGGQPPQPPLGIWGPPDMPPGYWGGGMGPGVKPQPPFPQQPPSGAHPSHPIYFPDAKPEHPIVLPPDLPPTIDEKPIEWKVGWTEETGWIVVGVPQGPHPTPSGG